MDRCGKTRYWLGVIQFSALRGPALPDGLEGGDLAAPVERRGSHRARSFEASQGRPVALRQLPGLLFPPQQRDHSFGERRLDGETTGGTQFLKPPKVHYCHYVTVHTRLPPLQLLAFIKIATDIMSVRGRPLAEGLL